MSLDKTNIKNLFEVESAGEQQFVDYWKDRIVNRKVPISDTISKNKFHIFTSAKREATKAEKKLKAVKNNVDVKNNNDSSFHAKPEMATLTHFFLTKISRLHLH